MRTTFIRLLALASLSMCLATASVSAQEASKDTNSSAKDAQSSQPKDNQAKESPSSSTAPDANASATAAPAPAPVAPVITFEKGLLTIVAKNSTLSDILDAVQQKTGAIMESAAGMSTERVIGQFGPGTPGAVISSLLNGSSLNYVLVGSADGSQLAKVLLSLRPSHVDVQTAEEGGSRRRRKGGVLEAMQMQMQEPQDGQADAQADVAQGDPAAGPKTRKHRKGGAADAPADQAQSSTDPAPTEGDNTAANNADGTSPSTDPNSNTTATNNTDPNNTNNGSTDQNAIGAAIASPILPPDAPENIMKAIQHGNGGPRTPTSAGAQSAASNGGGNFGGGPVDPLPGNSGGTRVSLPNGGTILGPGYSLPGGGMFFPGGIQLPAPPHR